MQWRKTAHEPTTHNGRTRQRQRWTEFLLLGYQVEKYWVLLRWGWTGRRLRALTDLASVLRQLDKM